MPIVQTELLRTLKFVPNSIIFNNLHPNDLPSSYPMLWIATCEQRFLLIIQNDSLQAPNQTNNCVLRWLKLAGSNYVGRFEELCLFFDCYKLITLEYLLGCCHIR